MPTINVILTFYLCRFLRIRPSISINLLPLPRPRNYGRRGSLFLTHRVTPPLPPRPLSRTATTFLGVTAPSSITVALLPRLHPPVFLPPPARPLPLLAAPEFRQLPRVRLAAPLRVKLVETAAVLKATLMVILSSLFQRPLSLWLASPRPPSRSSCRTLMFLQPSPPNPTYHSFKRWQSFRIIIPPSSTPAVSTLHASSPAQHWFFGSYSYTMVIRNTYIYLC